MQNKDKKKLPILLQRKKLYQALNDTVALFPGLFVIFTLMWIYFNEHYYQYQGTIIHGVS